MFLWKLYDSEICAVNTLWLDISLSDKILYYVGDSRQCKNMRKRTITNIILIVFFLVFIYIHMYSIILCNVYIKYIYSA